MENQNSYSGCYSYDLSSDIFNENLYKFSIIINFSNNENYISECIDSIINQNIGFEYNVQIILVDNNSTDSSLDICLDYVKKYPNNIQLLSKDYSDDFDLENKGPRSIGLKAATGDYIHFLEANDKLDSGVLLEVDKFFNRHPNLNIVYLPIFLFDEDSREYDFNKSFSKKNVLDFVKGDEYVDLVREYEYNQLSINSLFIRYDFNFSYDYGYYGFDDEFFVNKLLIDYKKYGLIKKVGYLRRKDVKLDLCGSNEMSLDAGGVDNNQDNKQDLNCDISLNKDLFYNKLNYVLELIRFSLEYEPPNLVFIDSYDSITNTFSNAYNSVFTDYDNDLVTDDAVFNTSGIVLSFIQYHLLTVVEDIISLDEISDVLSKSDEEEFWKILNQILSYVDKSIIISHNGIDDASKRFLHAIKFIDFSSFIEEFLVKKDNYYYLSDSGNFTLDGNSLVLENSFDFNEVSGFDIGDIKEFQFIDDISYHSIGINNVSLDGESLHINGFYNSCVHNDLISIKILKEVLDDEGYYNSTNSSSVDTVSKISNKFLGINWSFVYNFNVRVPVDDDNKFRLKFKVGCNDLEFVSIVNNNDSKVANLFDCGSRLIVVESDALYVEDSSYFKKINYKFKGLLK